MVFEHLFGAVPSSEQVGGNPWEKASLPSRIAVAWMYPLIELGATRPLEQSDVYPLPKVHSGAVIHEIITEGWKAESKMKKPYFWLVLWRSFGHIWVYSALTHLPYLFVNICQPFLVSALIGYVVSGEVDFFGITSGYGVAFLMGGLAMISAACFSYGFYHVTRCGMLTRAAVMTMVFDKTLRISSAAKGTRSTGEIVTLLSIDAERMYMGCILSNWLWLGPLLVVCSMVLLVLVIGNAAYCAFVVLLFVSWLQMHLGTMVGRTRRELVKFTENRVKLTNEALQGIRVVKLYTWEDPILQRIDRIRLKEVEKISEYQFLRLFNTMLVVVGPMLVSFSLFLFFVLNGGELTIRRVYATYALLNIIRFPMALMPLAWTALTEAMVSEKRVTDFLLLDEMKDENNLLENELTNSSVDLGDGDGVELVLQNVNSADPVEVDDVAMKLMREGLKQAIPTHHTKKQMDVESARPTVPIVSISDADFHWEATAPRGENGQYLSTLRNVNLTINKGEFVAIVGNVGSGKSSLVSAILGQMNLLRGKQSLTGKVAYASQEHWIQNMKLYENVLFNADLHDDRYTKVMDASQLTQDLTSLPKADWTDIGERGINLSGGQKARVSVARALYAQDIDVYLFDDALASVDVHVGKAMFQEAFSELLHDKTRIVILSSNYHFLPHFDKIIVVAESGIAACDSYVNIREKFPQYSSRDGERSAQSSFPGTPSRKSPDLKENNEEEIEKKRKSGDSDDDLMMKEDREYGSVAYQTYLDYFSASSEGKDNKFSVFFPLLLLFAICQSGRILSDLWIGYWAEHMKDRGSETASQFYLHGYIIIVCTTAVLFCIRNSWFLHMSIGASTYLHQLLLAAILKAPINLYFDVTPMGRILNRFSQDLDMIDSLLPDFFLQNLQNGCQILGIICLCTMSSPYVVLVLLPVAVLFNVIRYYFSKSSREMKRLEGISRSPLFSLFVEVLQGLSTIRAFGRTRQFLKKHHDAMDENMRNFFCFWMANRWLSLRLDCISTCVVVTVAVLGVTMSNYGGVNPNYLGLALVYSLQLSGLLQWTVRVAIETENNMTAVERLMTFVKVPSEADSFCDSDPAKESWPLKGDIVLRNLKLRYRPELDLVLKGVDLTIPGGSKVGVCGRTGAGKSSFMLALFRIVEPEPGSEIIIDGVDILNIGLTTLRSRLTIIPQDPVMFCDTLRYNLDPFSIYSDSDIWEALDRVHLKDEVLEKFPSKLDHELTERGENISVGQRQLICIARALLRKSQIIIMDEATASVDSFTDQKIQSTIRSEFKNCTVLTIAHRLETIADSDIIVVMDDGKVGEFGSPFDLLNTGCHSGTFRSMIDALGPERRIVLEEQVIRRHKG